MQDILKQLDFTQEEIDKLKEYARMEEDEIIITTTKKYIDGNKTRIVKSTQTKNKQYAQNILKALSIEY